MGYVPVEARKSEGRLPIGTIAIDAIFTPVERVNFTVEDMRVNSAPLYQLSYRGINKDATL